MNIAPLTRDEMDRITEIMDGREFVILHWREEERAYVNSPLGDKMKPLLVKAAEHLNSGGKVNPVGYEEDDSWKDLI